MQTDELIEKQQLLLLQGARLRLQFQEQVQVVIRPLAVVDKMQSGLQWLQKNPQWPLAGMMLLVVLRPRHAITWGGRLWWAWRTYRQLYQPSNARL